MTGTFPAYGMSPSLSTITSTSSSITSSIPDTERECPALSPGPSRQAQVRGTDEGPRGDSRLKVRGAEEGTQLIPATSHCTFPSADTWPSLNSVCL